MFYRITTYTETIIQADTEEEARDKFWDSYSLGDEDVEVVCIGEE